MKQDSKPYDLEERTFQFALSVRLFLRQHKWDPVSWSDVTQVLRSSGSVAANFVEANESISLDDKLYRLRLCRKEAKESSLWLRLIEDERRAMVNSNRDDDIGTFWDQETNSPGNLDIEAVGALIECIRKFEGGVVLWWRWCCAILCWQHCSLK
jgi:four helix bundle protein